MRPTLILLALLACDPADSAPFCAEPSDEPVPRKLYIDQYPEDPFRFGCSLPPVDISDMDARSCLIMMATCTDAQIGQCDPENPKGCIAALGTCFAGIESACWSRLK